MSLPSLKRREPALPHAVPRRQQVNDVDRAVQAITTFSALPTQQIDDAIVGLRDELAKLETMAQNLRNAYVDASNRLLRYIDRQKAVHSLTATAFQAMREGCQALDQPELPFSAPTATPEAPEGIPAATEEPAQGAV